MNQKRNLYRGNRVGKVEQTRIYIVYHATNITCMTLTKVNPGMDANKANSPLSYKSAEYIYI